MEDFPQFMKNSRNRISSKEQNTEDIEGYFYTGADGSQMAFWTCRADRVSKKHTHKFDEYMVCVAGQYTVLMNGEEHVLNPGDELLIPKGTEQWGRCIAGTRTIHAFGGRRIKGGQQPAMDASMIAPCGMNCAVCLGYLRDKNRCPGCNKIEDEKPDYCVRCRIRNCDELKESQAKFCYDCGKFPCARMKQLDKRYRTRYATSLIGNLEQIKNTGMAKFLKGEKSRWKCQICGGTICIHRGYCLNCGKKK